MPEIILFLFGHCLRAEGVKGEKANDISLFVARHLLYLIGGSNCSGYEDYGHLGCCAV
jgi:hypothetical protein